MSKGITFAKPMGTNQWNIFLPFKLVIFEIAAIYCDVIAWNNGNINKHFNVTITIVLVKPQIQHRIIKEVIG